MTGRPCVRSACEVPIFDPHIDRAALAQHVSSSGQNHVGLQFIGKPWERLRSIPVDRAGEYVFALRPRMEKYTDRLMCEVKVQDNVKIVTFRSTYKVENQTLYPLELTLIDDSGHPVYSIEKIGTENATIDMIILIMSRSSGARLRVTHRSGCSESNQAPAGP